MKNTTENTCSICGASYIGFGHNAAPITNGRCCDICNDTVVIPTRIHEAMGGDIEPIINKVMNAKLDALIAAHS
jgi:hypothetical protein